MRRALPCRRSLAQRYQRVLPVLGLLLASGCADDALMSPTIKPRVIVHAVLDAQLSEQLVFVELSQGGTLSGVAVPNANDIVASAGGRPISHATVRITGPLDTVLAIEDLTKQAAGAGAGVYRVRTAFAATASASLRQAGVLRLIPGARYDLEVRTEQAVVTGTTRLPDIQAPADRSSRVFNLDTDTLRLSHTSARAAGFFLRRMLPGFHRSEAFETTIANELLAPAGTAASAASPALAGGAFTRWRDAIIPGTVQQFSVVALDSNYLRYAVIGADPFGDDVRGNSLRGGVGLFGSVATLTDVTLELVAEREHAIEGDWITDVKLSGMPVRLRLYESPDFAQASRAMGVAFTGSARFANGVNMFVEATAAGQSHALRLRSSVKGVEQQLTVRLDGDALIVTSPERTTGVRYRRQ